MRPLTAFLRPFGAVGRRFPAFSAAVAICLAASLATVVAVRIAFHDPRPTVVMLGDCSTDNFRLWPGSRFHELVEAADPGVRAFNVAEAGALPADLFPLYAKARLATGSARYAVVGLEVANFVHGNETERLMYAGRQLRWIPVSRAGLAYFLDLTPDQMATAVVQRVSQFLYLPGDVAIDGWARAVDWPSWREQIRASPESPELVLDKSRRSAEEFAATPVWSFASLDTLQRARDFREALRLLREEGVEPLVLFYPYGDSDLIARTHSAASLAKIDSLTAAMRTFLESTGVDFLDFTTARERANFPHPVWFDQQNLGRAEPYRRMAEGIARWRRGEPDPALVRGRH